MYVEAVDNATKQPEVCSWPSEMMSNYFNFQKEIKSILLWSAAEEKRFRASTSKWWLFTEKVLKLPSALDVLATNVRWNTKSNISTLGTSAVLLLLASASVLQSNTEWLAVLFKDRPIVRDYKQMLDIETDLYDVAYFRSKKVNLLKELEDDSEIYQKLDDIIIKYQELWLLKKGNKEKIDRGISMADIILEMVTMNTYMKHFILYPGKNTLNKYYGCFWQNLICDENNSVLIFETKAIDDLDEAYSGLWMFWACNLYASNFKSSISKSLNNNEKSIKQSFDDIKQATSRLKSALVGKWAWNFKNKRKGMCDNISEYEMAQLKAYRWPDWECWKALNTSFRVSKIWWLLWDKKVQDEQKEKEKTFLDEKSSNSGSGSDNKDVICSSKSENIPQKWYQLFWNEDHYNKEFKCDMLYEFDKINELLKDYDQSYANAVSSDISLELSKIKWLLDMVKVSMDSAEHLRKSLKSISDYQCSQ